MQSNKSCDPLEIYQHLKWSYSLVFYVVPEVFITLAAIFGNLLIFIAFFREKELEKRKINFYIISLAIADFLVGLIGVPTGVLAAILGFQKPIDMPSLCNDVLCYLPMSLSLTCSHISIYSLVIISIKRLKILSSKSLNLNLSRNMAIEIGFGLIISSVIGFIPTVWNNRKENRCILSEVITPGYVLLRFIVAVIIPSIILGYVYFKIYILIKTQEKKRLQREMSKSWKSSFNLSENSNQKLFRKEVRATKSIAIIVVLFWISWIPLQILYLTNIICKDCVPKPLIAVNLWFVHSNSAINPILYAYRMKDIRRSIFKLFGKEVLELSSSSD